MPPVPKKKPTPTGQVDQYSWPFGRTNYIWFAIAMAVVIAGYISLASGSITLAPFLLVVGYCVLIPYSIMVRDKSPKSNSADPSDPIPPASA